ncbi:hypothetical protein ACSGEQ_10470 [Klebsiella pneumoniae]|uniref:hypothetical protein n=1 Tax=Klebsiella pneumoniae TaxID=573 RepID=UPI001F4D8161|nr:hypothetical protein [Klebsiella pneumoniae]MCH9452582.1 hypothetical protein [Klebsiella pneumoniae]
MILIHAGFGLSIKQGHMFGQKESNRKMVAIKLPFICIYWLNKHATAYWYECARAAFNDPDWFVENHHAVRQAKRKATITRMKAYQQAWEEHRTRYQKDMEKLEDENMRLKKSLAEAMRDIEAFSRIVGSKDA